jgi:hypothetical protein
MAPAAVPDAVARLGHGSLLLMLSADGGDNRRGRGLKLALGLGGHEQGGGSDEWDASWLRGRLRIGLLRPRFASFRVTRSVALADDRATPVHTAVGTACLGTAGCAMSAAAAAGCCHEVSEGAAYCPAAAVGVRPASSGLAWASSDNPPAEAAVCGTLLIAA